MAYKILASDRNRFYDQLARRAAQSTYITPLVRPITPDHDQDLDLDKVAESEAVQSRISPTQTREQDHAPLVGAHASKRLPIESLTGVTPGVATALPEGQTPDQVTTLPHRPLADPVRTLVSPALCRAESDGQSVADSARYISSTIRDFGSPPPSISSTSPPAPASPRQRDEIHSLSSSISHSSPPEDPPASRLLDQQSDQSKTRAAPPISAMADAKAVNATLLTLQRLIQENSRFGRAGDINGAGVGGGYDPERLPRGQVPQADLRRAYEVS